MTMMPDETRVEVLARRFADLKILSQKASDGAWLHYDKVFRKQFGKGRVTEIQRYGDGKPIVNWAGFDGLPDVTARKKNQNARFIVELVNFFRKHADDLGALLAFAAPPAGEREERVGKYGCLRESLDRDIERTGTLESFMIRAGLLRDILDDLDALAAIKVGDSHLNEPALSLPLPADREAIARIIDPIAFKSWASMIEHCERVGEPEEDGLRYANNTYLKTMEEARSKADAILTLPTPSAGRDGGGE